MPFSELSVLFNNEKYSDVTFEIGPTKAKVFANKALLASASPIFEELLFDQNKDTVQLESIDVESFLALLKFIYSGDEAITPETVSKIIYCAKRYDVESAEVRCEEYYERGINDTNAIILWEEADKFQLKNLAEKCLKYVCKRAGKIFEGNNHLSLSKKTLLALVSRDDLRVREVTLFNAVVAWSKVNTQNEQDYKSSLADFLPYIRFTQIRAKDMINHVFPTGTFSKSDQLKILCNRVLNNDKPQGKARSGIECEHDIKEMISFKQLQNEGWRTVYQFPMSHSTTNQELRDLLAKVSDDTQICVAARKANSDDILLCAFGKARDVLTPTQDKNKAVKHGDDSKVYWYLVEDQSFGFAEAENISLGSADTVSGDHRMSWHLSGGGGYRFGEHKDLNSDSVHEKLIMFLD